MNEPHSDPKSEEISTSSPHRSWYLDERGEVQFRVEFKNVERVTIFDDVAEIAPTANRR